MAAACNRIPGMVQSMPLSVPVLSKAGPRNCFPRSRVLYLRRSTLARPLKTGGCLLPAQTLTPKQGSSCLCHHLAHLSQANLKTFVPAQGVHDSVPGHIRPCTSDAHLQVIFSTPHPCRLHMVGFSHPSVHVPITAVQGAAVRLIRDNAVSHLLARQDVSPVKTASRLHVTLHELARVKCVERQQVVCTVTRCALAVGLQGEPYHKQAPCAKVTFPVRAPAFHHVRAWLLAPPH